MIKQVFKKEVVLTALLFMLQTLPVYSNSDPLRIREEVARSADIGRGETKKPDQSVSRTQPPQNPSATVHRASMNSSTVERFFSAAKRFSAKEGHRLITQAFLPTKSTPPSSRCIQEGSIDGESCADLLAILDRLDQMEITTRERQEKEGESVHGNLKEQARGGGAIRSGEALQGGIKNQLHQGEERVSMNSTELAILSAKINDFPTPDKARKLFTGKNYQDKIRGETMNSLLKEVPDQNKQQFQEEINNANIDIPNPIDAALDQFEHDLFPNQNVLQRAKRRLLQVQTQMGLEIDNVESLKNQVSQVGQYVDVLKSSRDHARNNHHDHGFELSTFNSSAGEQDQEESRELSDEKLSLRDNESPEQSDQKDNSLIHEISPEKELEASEEESEKLAEDSQDKAKGEGEDEESLKSKKEDKGTNIAKNKNDNNKGAEKGSEEEEKEGKIAKKTRKNLKTLDLQSPEQEAQISSLGQGENKKSENQKKNSSEFKKKRQEFAKNKEKKRMRDKDRRHFSLLGHRLPASVISSRFNIFQRISARYNKVGAANRLLNR